MKHGLDSNNKKVTIKKRIINADSIQEFRDILPEVNWGNLYSISNPNDAYRIFLESFLRYIRSCISSQNYLG